MCLSVHLAMLHQSLFLLEPNKKFSIYNIIPFVKELQRAATLFLNCAPEGSHDAPLVLALRGSG